MTQTGGEIERSPHGAGFARAGRSNCSLQLEIRRRAVYGYDVGLEPKLERKVWAMSGYPVVEQDGYCASVSTEKEPTHRWRAWVSLERDGEADHAMASLAAAHRVPNDYPSEERALAAGYEYARELIAKGQALR